MKNIITVMSSILIFVGASGANASEIRCMAGVVDRVLIDLQNSLHSGRGVYVVDSENKRYYLNSLSVRDVRVRDLYKNAYEVRIQLQTLGKFSTNAWLTTSVAVRDYATCTFENRTEERLYRFRTP